MLLQIEHGETLTQKLGESVRCRIEGGRLYTDCHHDLRHTRRILAEMGFRPERVESLIDEFHSHGGHCDCEVAWNEPWRHAA